MKKLLSLALALALSMGLALPAGAVSAGAAPAEESADARLKQVTAKVKAALDIGDEYDNFYGEMWENELAPTWSLNWSAEGRSLTVEATEDGKVLSYSRNEEEGPAVSGGPFRPSFPAVSRAEAEQTAKAFLNRVLERPLETAKLAESGSSRLDSSAHRFRGTILLNGLPSPLSFSVTVRSSDGVVTRFWRDSLEGRCIGGVPSAQAKTSSGAAGALLKGTLSLRLEYVLDGEGETAVLRYLPNPTDEYYVDAKTGKLVNLTELYGAAAEKGFNSASGGATEAPAAAESAADNGLTETELAGIAKLEGVLSKEKLDSKLRELTALGLSRYTLASVSYSLDQETGDVTAWVAYTRRDEEGYWRRTVTADARTGALQGVSSSAPWKEGRKSAVSGAAAQKTAEDLLTSLWGEEYSQTALYESSIWTQESWSSSHSFTYAQRENGYFFPQNALSVSVDVTDGSISGLSRSWNGDVTFDSPQGIVDESAALNAWFAHYGVALGYREIPIRLDPNSGADRPLVEMGYDWFYGLTLSYALESSRWASGVDAKTGAVVYGAEPAEKTGIVYSDLEGHWAKAQALALAECGVGWTGGAFRPGQALTQLDLVALLASTRGYLYDGETGSADDLYRFAYETGILTRAQRDDSRVMTRGQVVKTLLDSAGYGEVAALPGIFTCSFADRASIPADLLGYAALAQGMGIVKGDSAGLFAAGRAATRAEAAVMLCNFMSR